MRIYRSWSFFVVAIILSLLLYPFYIGISGLLDYFWGDSLFAQEVLYGSPRAVLRSFLDNWMMSFPVSLGLVTLVILPAWTFMRRLPWLFYLSMLMAGALFGLYIFAGESLSAFSVAMTFFINAIITERFFRFAV